MSNLSIKERADAAEEVARYVLFDQAEGENYLEFVNAGGDPRRHIVYTACVVLGREREFQEDVDAYEQRKT